MTPLTVDQLATIRSSLRLLDGYESPRSRAIRLRALARARAERSPDYLAAKKKETT